MFICIKFCFQFFLKYKLVLCPCCRHDKDAALRGKHYDMTVCYNFNDAQWLDERFMPRLAKFNRGYKTHKLCMFRSMGERSVAAVALSDESKRILALSKRVVLMFSDSFLKYEWSNKSFRECVQRIYKQDKYGVIVAVNLGRLSTRKLQIAVDSLDTHANGKNYEYIVRDTKDCWSRMESRVRRSCAVDKIEFLNWVSCFF